MPNYFFFQMFAAHFVHLNEGQVNTPRQKPPAASMVNKTIQNECDFNPALCSYTYTIEKNSTLL